MVKFWNLLISILWVLMIVLLLIVSIVTKSNVLLIFSGVILIFGLILSFIIDDYPFTKQN